MKSTELHGIYPPIPTPFVNEQVSYDNLSNNINRWSKTDISGFVVLGSNGETVFLTEKEKRKVVEGVVKSSPPEKTIIAGTGCESTLESINLTRDCAEIGAHAALVLTPHYYGNNLDNRAITDHYLSIADKSNIPILLYNVPKFTHLSLSVSVVSELSRHPNIIGIKDSSGNVALLSEYLNNCDENFSVLVGTAGVLLAGLMLGCSGGVLALANVAANSCIKIAEHFHKGEINEASMLQLKMVPVNKAITATYGVSGLKTAMDIMGYFGGEPRSPLKKSTEKEKEEIRSILTTAGLIEDD